MSDERVYYSHDAEVQAERERTMLALVFLTLGMAIGTGLALLFAPKSGKKTRDGLTHTMEQGLKESRERVEPIAEQAEKEFGDLKKKVKKRLE
jgi:gas vesicle protein